MPALPESVRRQVELSNQLATKMKAGTLTFEDTQMTPQQVEMPAVMPATFQPQSAGTAVPGMQSATFNPQASEPQKPAAPAPAAPAPAPVVDEPQEQRYRVLQGKYNAEVPRLQKQTQEQERQLRHLQDQLTATQSLLAQVGQQQQAPAPRAPEPSLVTEQEIKDFGPDLIDVMTRVAKQAVGPQIRTLEQEFRPVAQTVQQMAPMVQQTAEDQGRTAAELAAEKLYTALDGAVPTWESVNNTPEFGNWLSQMDPYAGAKRGDMLSQAFRNGDATRVINFFTGFLNEHAALAPPAQTPAAPQGTPPAGKPLVDLRSMASPGTGVGGPASAGAPNESGQRVYSSAEVAAFYKDVQKGGFKGRENDKLAIERDIFLAQKQGRIRP